MLTAAKYSFLLLLFVLLFLLLKHLLLAVWRHRKARYRLLYVKNSQFSNRSAIWLSKFNVVNIHLRELIESAGSRWTLNSMVLVMFLLLVGGVMLGAFFFRNIKGVAVLSLISASLPYVLLRLKLISVRLRNRLEFLPAVEIFYQCYLVSEHKNISITLQTCIEENRMLYPIKPVFEQLYRNLVTQRNVEESLRIFAMSLGHVWADYLTGILRISLTEGNHITESLKELIVDMRKAQRYDQAERNRLLEIRIANFTPILFLALFLTINFKVNYTNAYQFYVLDPAGRGMLLDALLLIFVSFLMGIYLSMRRM